MALEIHLLLPVAAALSLAACGSSHTSTPGGGVTPAVASSPSTTASQKEEPGSDDNVAEYGQEAGPADRKAITELVARYYAAGAAADGARACRLLEPTIAGSVVEDYGSGAGPPYARGRTCAQVMAKIFKHRHPSELAGTHVLGVRVKGDNGFAELRNRMTPNGAINVRKVRGGWWVGVLIAHEIPARFRKSR